MAVVRKATDEERKNRDFSVSAGRYVLGFEDFERKEGKAKPYVGFLRFKIRIIKPDGKPSRSFRDIWSLLFDIKGDRNREKQVKFNIVRWQILAEVLELEPFEIGDNAEGTEAEGDRNVRKYLLGRAFVGEVDRRESGGYINNSVKRMIYPKDWTDAECEAVAAWESNYALAQQQKDDEPPTGPAESAGGESYDSFDDELDSGGSEDDDPLGW